MNSGTTIASSSLASRLMTVVFPQAGRPEERSVVVVAHEAGGFESLKADVLDQVAAMSLGSTPYASPAAAVKRSGLPSMDAAPAGSGIAPR